MQGAPMQGTPISMHVRSPRHTPRSPQAQQPSQRRARSPQFPQPSRLSLSDRDKCVGEGPAAPVPRGQSGESECEGRGQEGREGAGEYLSEGGRGEREREDRREGEGVEGRGKGHPGEVEVRARVVEAAPCQSRDPWGRNAGMLAVAYPCTLRLP